MLYSENGENFYLYAGESDKGDDGLAMKAAAHELHSAIQISKHCSQRFIVPMQCVIDFQGFRIVSHAMLIFHNTGLNACAASEEVVDCLRISW